MICYYSLQFVQWHGSTLSPKHLPTAEKHQRWHRLYAISLSKISYSVNIKLYDADAIAKILLQLFEHRMHLLAWSTPGGEEIHQCELIAIDYFILKSATALIR